MFNFNKNLNQKHSLANGVFNSHEPIFHATFLRHPLNASSSIFYWLPLYYIPSDNSLGIMILTCLAPISFLWWSTSSSYLKYIDNGLVLSTKIWLISVLIDKSTICYLIPFIFLIKNDKLIRAIAFLGSCTLLYFNTHNLSRVLFSISLISKLADSVKIYRYGTCFFHIFSGLAIYSFFRDLDVNLES